MADLKKAANSGDQRELYEAIKQDLVETLADASAYTKPGIVKQIIAVDEKLDKLPKPKKESPLAKAKRNA